MAGSPPRYVGVPEKMFEGRQFLSEALRSTDIENVSSASGHRRAESTSRRRAVSWPSYRRTIGRIM
jgi:hypothetical protein